MNEITLSTEIDSPLKTIANNIKDIISNNLIADQWQTPDSENTLYGVSAFMIEPTDQYSLLDFCRDSGWDSFLLQSGF